MMGLIEILQEIEENHLYLIHATSSKYRSSIEKNGLLPRDVKESPHFSKEDKLYLEYSKPGIFATKLGSSIDVYDIKNIKDRVYLVPSVTMDNYKNFKKIAARRINFISRMNNAKNKKEKYMIVSDLYHTIDKLCQQQGNYDVWLIDNSIANVRWEEDEYGKVGDLNAGWDDVNSVVTYQPIPRKSIELIVASGKNLKFK